MCVWKVGEEDGNFWPVEKIFCGGHGRPLVSVDVSTATARGSERR